MKGCDPVDVGVSFLGYVMEGILVSSLHTFEAQWHNLVSQLWAGLNQGRLELLSSRKLFVS